MSFTIPWRSLGKEDVVFHVVQDDELLGTLKVSKGAVVWWPGNAKLGYKLTFLTAPRLINCTGDRTPAREVLATRNL